MKRARVTSEKVKLFEQILLYKLNLIEKYVTQEFIEEQFPDICYNLARAVDVFTGYETDES